VPVRIPAPLPTFAAPPAVVATMAGRQELGGGQLLLQELVGVDQVIGDAQLVDLALPH
jgi:hypothetical protein